MKKNKTVAKSDVAEKTREVALTATDKTIADAAIDRITPAATEEATLHETLEATEPATDGVTDAAIEALFSSRR